MRIATASWPSLLASLLLAAPSAAQDSVRVDVSSGWVRRDWQECRDPTRLILEDGVATILSERSAALFWQIPTRSGRPRDVDMSRSWIRRCDRAPIRSAADGFASRDGERIAPYDRDSTLIKLRDYPYVTWRWRVDATLDDRKTANPRGKILKGGNDFPAKLGFSFLKGDSDDLCEIAYVWTRSLPEESVVFQETKVVLGLWKKLWYRIVAESGEAHVGQWVEETRDLYADYRRLFPKNPPARIMRVYLMTDTDDTGGRVTASYTDIVFHRSRPGGEVE